MTGDSEILTRALARPIIEALVEGICGTARRRGVRQAAGAAATIGPIGVGSIGALVGDGVARAADRALGFAVGQAVDRGGVGLGVGEALTRHRVEVGTARYSSHVFLVSMRVYSTARLYLVGDLGWVSDGT
jgi:hypothetical protein